MHNHISDAIQYLLGINNMHTIITSNTGIGNWYPPAHSPTKSKQPSDGIVVSTSGTISANDFPIGVPVYITEKTVKCECGSDSIGVMKHSSYCPKYEAE